MITHKGDNTKAARSAGYSPKTCVEQGYQLFIKLQDYIAPLTQELVRSHALRAEQVVQGLSLIALSDIGDYVKWERANSSEVGRRAWKGNIWTRPQCQETEEPRGPQRNEGSGLLISGLT